MPRTVYKQSRGGPALRFRGRKRTVGHKFTQRQIIQALVFLALMMIVLAIGMYLGWWSALEEEKETENRLALLSRANPTGERHASTEDLFF